DVTKELETLAYLIIKKYFIERNEEEICVLQKWTQQFKFFQDLNQKKSNQALKLHEKCCSRLKFETLEAGSQVFMVDLINFQQDCPDEENDLIYKQMGIVQLKRNIKIEEKNKEEICFLQRQKQKYLQAPIIEYLKGQQFGEIEVINDTNRNNDAICISNKYKVTSPDYTKIKLRQIIHVQGDIKNTLNYELMSTQAFYDLPSLKMYRASGIGYGGKYDFTKQTTKTPAPNAYEQKYNTIIGDKKGWSFGLSREQMTICSGPLGVSMASKGPGPGTYKSVSGLSSQAFTLRMKTQSPDQKNTYLKTPGPGAYSYLPAITENGKYFVSKFKNSGTCTFNPKGQRFANNIKDLNPGPGAYPSIAGITINGQYFVSKYKSSGCRTFTHGARKPEQVGMHKGPGPGSYRLPSEFGYYEKVPK
ncbi:hypothetical protein IMG5_177780, partial [Ichthyophthirius multifiliis]